MQLDPWMWVAFGTFVVAMLAVDLVAFGRRGEEIPFRRAFGWSVGWTALGAGTSHSLLVRSGRFQASADSSGGKAEGAAVVVCT